MGDLKSEISACNDVFMKHYKNNQMEKLSELYTEDCNVMPTGSPTVTGRKGCAAVFQSVYDAGNVCAKLVIEEVGVVHTDSVAFERSKYHFYNAKGEETDFGSYVVVWKKINGKWMLHNDIFNTDKS